MATSVAEKESDENLSPPGFHRLKDYKTKGIVVDKIRARQEEEGIQLRKEKRQQELIKRRNLTEEESEKKDEVIKEAKEVANILKENQKEDENIDDINKNKNKDFQQNKDKEDEVSVATPLDRLVDVVRNGSENKKLSAVRVIRQLLSNLEPRIDDIIDSGVVPDLVECVKADEPEQLQIEAAWALTNIASGNSDQTKFVVQSGAVPRLIQLLESHNELVKEQVMWGLGNIIGDCPDYRDLVIDYGILLILSDIIGHEDESIRVRRQGSWALSNICRHKHQPLSDDIVNDVMPMYCKGLDLEKDVQCLSDLCWGVSYLTDDCAYDRMQQILNTNILSHVVELMKIHNCKSILHPAIRTVGNITTSTDEHTQKIIDLQSLPILKSLLNHELLAIKKESCWALSNITAGTLAQKQAVIDENIVPMFLDILSGDASFQLKKEAVWAVANITEGASEQQISYLVGLGGIQSLCHCVTFPDNNIIKVALDGILGILRIGDQVLNDDGVNPYASLIPDLDDYDSLVELLDNENEDIFKLASDIIDKYVND